LAPIYEQLATVFKGESNCVVANLDATTSNDIADQYQVTGYPTLKFFAKDGSVKDFEGDRGLQEMILYLNKNCHTHRKLDGHVDEKAGRVRLFDDLVNQFMAAKTEKEKLGLIKAGKIEVIKNDTKFTKYYVKVMEKMVENPEFAFKESERLGKISKGALADDKRDFFQMRRNILSVFIKKGKEHEEL
jgi:protein disulfide-isomerase A6